MPGIDESTTRADAAYGFSATALCTRSTVYRSDLLEGRSHVVSGAGSGIGRATAFLLTRLGARVLMCGRDESKLATVARSPEVWAANPGPS